MALKRPTTPEEFEARIAKMRAESEGDPTLEKLCSEFEKMAARVKELAPNGAKSLDEIQKEVDQIKAEDWERVRQDPNTSGKFEEHEMLCDYLDDMMADARARERAIEADFYQTSDAMLDLVVAYRRGDQKEVNRLLAESRRDEESME